MNFQIPAYYQFSGQAEAASKVYEKVEGKGNRTYYIPTDSKERAGNIYVDTKDPKSNGFGGSILTFKLSDGSEDKVKGPWHTNSDSFFKDSGIDIRDEHRTFVVLAKEYKYEDGKTILVDVVYQDPEGGIIGNFDRHKYLQKEYPEAMRYFSSSRGGSSSGPTETWYALNKK